MSRNIFQPLVIKTFRTDQIDCPPMHHSYFELVFVESGSGYRTVDGHRLNFKQNYLFLHLPQEPISVSLNEYSVLHFIKFQRVLFNMSGGEGSLSFREWFKRIEFILFSNKGKEEDLIVNEEDRNTICHLMQVVEREHQSQTPFFDLNLNALLFILLNITARNILKRSIQVAGNPLSGAEEKDILNYINYHIFDAARISLTHLSGTFNISPSYFSEYFKHRYSMTLKQYILEYKLKLAESRLKYTNQSLTEIAAELQFTDTSHLNRIFKKYKGIYPRDIKRKAIA